MTNLVVPNTDTQLYIGCVVVFSKYPEVRWVLHFGWFMYESDERYGWYFKSVPTGVVIPADEVDLTEAQIIDNPCPPIPFVPGTTVPFTVTLRDQVYAAFITVQTLDDLNALDASMFPDGKLVRVNNVNDTVAYYTWSSAENQWTLVDYVSVAEFEALASEVAQKQDSLTAGVGINLNNNIIDIADIPSIDLSTTQSTTITDVAIQNWMQKCLPVKYSDSIYWAHLSTLSGKITYQEVFIDSALGSIGSHIFLYTVSTHVASRVTNNVIERAADNQLGLIKLGTNTRQTSSAVVASSTEGRTYPVQLNEVDQAVVNVPWTAPLTVVYTATNNTITCNQEWQTIKDAIDHNMPIQGWYINSASTPQSIYSFKFSNAVSTIHAYYDIGGTANGDILQDVIEDIYVSDYDRRIIQRSTSKSNVLPGVTASDNGSVAAVVNGQWTKSQLKTVNGSSILGSGDLTTYQTFSSSWRTSGTIDQFCYDVDHDASTSKGTAYLGELSCSDLPFSGNADTVVEIVDGTAVGSKAIHVTITSGNRTPYRWEYTYWGNGSLTTPGWISFTTPLTFTNVSVSTWVSDATYADFPYRASVALTGVTANSFAQVVFSVADAMSGNYAPVAETYAGGIYLYSAVNAAITIPTVYVLT